MDKFQELIDELNDMSEADKAHKIKELEKKCVCPVCPTYNQCAKDNDENIFCIKDRSNCIDQEKGCMCPTCPFASEFKIGVFNNFYCMRGRELEQRKG